MNYKVMAQIARMPGGGGDGDEGTGDDDNGGK